MAELTKEQIQQISERATRATAGPWETYHRISPRGAHKQWHIGNAEGLCQITMGGKERDYEFIAHARIDIPALIETIAAKDAEIARLRRFDAKSRESGCWCDEYGHPCKACEAQSELRATLAEKEARLMTCKCGA